MMPERSQERRPVLLVEDDPDVREAFLDVIDEAGYRVFTASNGADALKLLPELPPVGLVLVDMMMPVMDGIEFISRVREAAALRGVPVILLTAAARIAAPPGVNGVLQKPVDLDDLLRTVKSHCG
jgi:CheY-like chemotaxis protein